jgi:hypothetical protein
MRCTLFPYTTLFRSPQNPKTPLNAQWEELKFNININMKGSTASIGQGGIRTFTAGSNSIEDLGQLP